MRLSRAPLTASLALLAATAGMIVPKVADAYRPRAAAAITGQITAGSFVMPGQGNIEVAFSPDEGAEDLVVKVIDSARQNVWVMAYSFTSTPITQALVRAANRRVDVDIVVDAKQNLHSKVARAALNALVLAGADVRTISVYADAHG